MAQGCVLGPLLFIVFINEIIDVFHQPIMAKLYVDDLKYYVAIINSSENDSIIL